MFTDLVRIQSSSKQIVWKLYCSEYEFSIYNIWSDSVILSFHGCSQSYDQKRNHKVQIVTRQLKRKSAPGPEQPVGAR